MNVWRRWMRMIDARAARERWLIAGTVLAVVLLIGDLLVLQPVLGRRAELVQQRQSLEGTLHRQEDEIARLRIALASDPNLAPRRRLAEVEAEIEALQREIGEMTSRLIKPGEMAGMLKAMLSRTDALELVALENLEPIPLDDDADPDPGSSGAFRHGLRLELEGSFHAALAYLQLLESLPWGFFWDRLEIVTQRYPDNRIRLEIYTVSVGREWLGV